MRPFGCLVTILNTIDHLGKFDGKADEGFFVGYSLNSKSFRVFNIRTKIVEENLHIRFSESTPNVVGSGPDWLFDIDALTRTMNYDLIVTSIQSNGFAGTKASDNTGQVRKDTELAKDYILLPLWTDGLPFFQDPKSSHDDGSKRSSDDGKKVDEDPRKENECNDQEKEDNVNNTNNVNTVSLTFNVAGTNEDNELPFDPNMPALEDFTIFNFLSDDEDDDHPLDQVIRDLQSAIQTRKMSKNLEEHGFVFRNKKDERGIVIRNKARLVAQGYTQEEEIDYNEVFDHIARIEAISLFLAYASFKDFVVYLIDVKSAFLYKKIEKEVYICQPLGFKDLDFPDRVYKVEKALYGLHQALRAWPTEVKTASIPMKTQKPLLKGRDGKEVDVHMYRSMIGSLVYLTSSRPDVMFAMCACARYQVNPKVSYLHDVRRIFRYLKSQLKLGLWYPKDSPFDLVAYTNSDYAGASLDKKSTTGAKTINGEVQIHIQVDGKEIVITESSVKRDLQLVNEEGIDCFPNSTIFEQLALMGKPKRKDTQVPQPSGPTDNDADEDVHKELGNSLVRVATTTSSLEEEQDNGNINKNQSKATPNKSSSQGTNSGDGPRVESSYDEESLGENASKQERRIDAIDADENITLVNDVDNEMFDVDDLGGEEVFVAEQNENVVEEIVDAAQGKGIMIEEHVKPKKKDQIRLDEEAALKLQAKFDEEERLARERAEKEKEEKKRELEQEITKKQKVKDDKEKTEFKQLMETISDEEEVAIDAIPLAVKSLRIVDRKTHKEGKKNGLSLMATKIGAPMMLDWYTNFMCLESKVRSSYARILIEINFRNYFIYLLVMAVSNLEGIGYTKETIRIEYEWEPPRCSTCLIFGHSPADCPKAPKAIDIWSITMGI
uniref:Uncharacterized protein n=1 Tax=Tanacetum cinerariifolium TaxID=118510 RepID=A0A6L2KTS9_TANCI|nr:hypothetical protein [Tanacetum cinerariifolium]